MKSNLLWKLTKVVGWIVMANASFTSFAAESETDSALDLEGTNWQLVRLVVLGGYEFFPDAPEKFYLNFRGDQRLTGSSDCNELGGLWIQDGYMLHFDPFLTSRRLCEPGSLHSNFSLYIRDAAEFEIREGNLLITTNTDGIEIEFEAR